MRLSPKTIVWTAVGLLLAVIFLYAATDREVYQATSPSSLIAHVWFRKAYSIVAFSIVGFIVARWFRSRPTSHRIASSAAIVAFYSALIEAAQKMHGSSESWRWNLFDIACGLVGGALGAAFYRPRDR